MAPSIGVNLRVTGHCNQGGRKYMEDMFSVAYQQTEDEKDLEYAFFGIFDGHGGREAAMFAKEHLMDFIVTQKNFWSDDDELVLKAIRDGFISTHYAMWRELESWPKTASGLPSTSGTTASIAFIRRGKIYTGHVGDSAIVLGYQADGESTWHSKPLTRDHKPESQPETERIHQSGGKVICKSGVPRVVWNRPRLGHKGPVRRSTLIDEIPFLAVARSLGDLWSYNSNCNQFVVSPEPDVGMLPVEVGAHRCLVLGTDGLWNMLSPEAAVATVLAAERHNEKHVLSGQDGRVWINPSKRLVDRALERWNNSRLRADNTSVVTVMLDPPGPPRAQVLLRQKQLELAERENRPAMAVRHRDCDDGHPSNDHGYKCHRPSIPHSHHAHLKDDVSGDRSRGASSKLQALSTSNQEDQKAEQRGVAIFARHPVTGEATDVEPSAGDRPSPDSSSGESSGRVREVTKILHDIVAAPSNIVPRQPPLEMVNSPSYRDIQINEVSSTDGENEGPRRPLRSLRGSRPPKLRGTVPRKRRRSSQVPPLSATPTEEKRRTRSDERRLVEDSGGASDTENRLSMNPAEPHHTRSVTGLPAVSIKEKALASSRTLRSRNGDSTAADASAPKRKRCAETSILGTTTTLSKSLRTHDSRHRPWSVRPMLTRSKVRRSHK